MSTYSFRCSDCHESVDVSVPMSEISRFQPGACPVCGGMMRRAYSAPSIKVPVHVSSKSVDTIKETLDAREEMKENHLVHGVSPLAGQSELDVYKEIRSSGSKVREQMEKSREEGISQAREENRKRLEALKPNLERKNAEIQSHVNQRKAAAGR